MTVPGPLQKKIMCQYEGCTMMFNSIIQRSDHARWGHPPDDKLKSKKARKSLSDSVKTDTPQKFEGLLEQLTTSLNDSKSRYIVNNSTIYEEPKEKCDNCGRLIAVVSLPLHLEKCNQKLEFKCKHEGCEVSFRTKLSRDCHVRNVHEPPVKCPVQNCNKMIKKNSLATHMRIVHIKMKVKCKECGKLVQRYNMVRHKRGCTTKGEKLFGCTVEGCKAMFATADSRHHHIHQAHQEPIRCIFKDCDQLVKPFYLKKHIRNKHTNESKKKGNKSKKIKIDPKE